MNIDWKTVMAVVVAIIIVFGAWMLLTKRKVDAATGQVVTKFSGFGGDDGE